MKTQTGLCTTYLPFVPALAAESAGRTRPPVKRRRSPRLKRMGASHSHIRGSPLPCVSGNGELLGLGQTRPQFLGQAVAPAHERASSW